jgi:hypothetical protein
MTSPPPPPVIQQPFRPFELLKQKPIPGVFHQTNEARKSSADGGILIETIVENLEDSHRALDRSTVLQRLQSNGFLVKPCEEMSVPDVERQTPTPPHRDTGDSDSDSDSDEEEEDDKEDDAAQNKGKKLVLEDKIVLEEERDKTLEEEKIPEKEIQPKEIPLPKEHAFNGETVNQELIIDDKTVFIVCNEKKEQKPPGKEPSETIPKERTEEFAALSRIPDWRQKLCNEHDAPFKLDDVVWKHVDHFILAAKYRKQPLLKESFTDYDKAIEIHKSKKFGGKKIAVDADAEERAKQDMYHALYAKFTQNPELARVLHATLDAKLLYRVNKQVKEEFTELMWLRQILRAYVKSKLQPLTEAPLPLKTRKRAVTAAVDQVQDLTNVSISKYAVQLPKYEPDVLRVSSYYMNNRMEFISKLNDMFKKLNQTKPVSSSFDLMEHQRLVLNYIHHDRPYHGLLVFHNLGTGKSCTSIAIAEGMKHEKQIIIMMPASLKTNYWSELQKCGDVLYKQNQHWEFVSVDGKPDLVPILARSLSMTTDEIRKQKGAWMVNIQKEPNFKNLPPSDQNSVQTQITHMIGQKYHNIHYNANNLATKINELGKGKKNPFDHTVVILDEAHNFVSRIVGNLRKKKKADQSIYTKIYEQMLKAKDFRIVMLSGTPIINNPHEMGVMFNLLRGGISTWTLTVTGGQNTEQIKSILEKGKCGTFDFIEFKHGKITITRNPYGFVNVNVKPPSSSDNTRKLLPIDAIHGAIVSRKQNKTKKQSGGYGEFGVKLDARGNVDNDAFVKQVKHILKDNDIIVTKVQEKLEKCLPDDQDVFQKTFLRESTNFSDLKDTTTDLLKLNTLRRRILGLTSYYRVSSEDVLPRIIKDNENIFHEIRVPMSDYQFEAYAKVRKIELDKEKKQKTIRGLQKQVDNGELFSMNSTYRVFSRCCCNFAFPTPPGRPLPVGGKIKENEDMDDIDEATIEDNSPIDRAEFAEESGEDVTYGKKIAEAMGFLRANRATVFTQTNLGQYSPKMLEILRRLKNPQNKGLHLVYSTFRTLEGIGIFQEVLHAHGYQEFKIAKKGDQWELDFKPDGRPCYALYTGKEDAEMKEIVRNVFNGDWNPPNVPDSIGVKLREIASNNLYGEIVQLFMITASGAEGINLKNTRFVHIMEPYWHNVRLEQVMGRARRIRSHEALPPEHRTVQAFLYLSVMTEKQMKDDNFKEIQVNDLSKLRDNTPVTTDEFLYEISQMKQKINNQFLTVMKETAMDCHVHIKNHRKNEKLVCYAPVSGHRTFSDYPELEKVLQEDHNEHLGK